MSCVIDSVRVPDAEVTEKLRVVLFLPLASIALSPDASAWLA
jgi:hypothetical protein